MDQIPAPLIPNDLTPHLNGRFDVAGSTGGLTLVAVEPLPGAPRAGGGFRLEFVAPAADAILSQGTYAFSRNGFVADIFIVPIGRAGDDIRYEAIFT